MAWQDFFNNETMPPNQMTPNYGTMPVNAFNPMVAPYTPGQGSMIPPEAYNQYTPPGQAQPMDRVGQQPGPQGVSQPQGTPPSGQMPPNRAVGGTTQAGPAPGQMPTSLPGQQPGQGAGNQSAGGTAQAAAPPANGGQPQQQTAPTPAPFNWAQNWWNNQPAAWQAANKPATPAPVGGATQANGAPPGGYGINGGGMNQQGNQPTGQPTGNPPPAVSQTPPPAAVSRQPIQRPTLAGGDYNVIGHDGIPMPPGPPPPPPQMGGAPPGQPGQLPPYVAMLAALLQAHQAPRGALPPGAGIHPAIAGRHPGPARHAGPPAGPGLGGPPTRVA